MSRRRTAQPESVPPEQQEAEQQRFRLIVDIDDPVLHAAAQLRASKQSVVAKRKVSKSEIVTSILREALEAEIQEIRRYEKQSQR